MDFLNNRRSFSFWVIGVLLLAFCVRILAAIYWQSLLDDPATRFRFGDSDTYWVLAQRIAQGENYEYGGKDSRAFRAPGYPLFLASIIAIWGNNAVLIARLAGATVGALTVGLLMIATYDFARRGKASDRVVRTASLCCGVFAAVYPGAIGMSIFILSEAIFCPLMATSLIAWNRSELSKNAVGQFGWSGLAGAATGAACLCRPSWLLWPGLMAILSLGRCFLSVSRPSLENNPNSISSYCASPTVTVASLAIFGMGTALVMTPWWIRNYLVFNAFVPTTLQVGASLFDGLHDGASGASDEGMAFTLETENALRAFDEQWHRLHDKSNAAGPGRNGDSENASEHREKIDISAKLSLSAHGLANELGDLKSDTLIPFEIRLNKILFHKAIAWVVENPYATARLALVKFVKMWTPFPTAKEVGGQGVHAAEAIGYLAIIGFAISGFYLMNPNMRYMAIVYASPVLYFAGLHTIFVGSVRYRQPAILVLTIVSGIGAAWMLDQIEWKRKRLN